MVWDYVMTMVQTRSKCLPQTDIELIIVIDTVALIKRHRNVKAQRSDSRIIAETKARSP